MLHNTQTEREKFTFVNMRSVIKLRYITNVVNEQNDL